MAETITMRREGYCANQSRCDHAGLMLERGFAEWHSENHNEQKTVFYDKLTQIKASDFYSQAYQRWQDYLFQETSNSKVWAAKLEGRLYLGLGEASPLESAITLHHTYGVPFIPGSAIKGVLHHALLAKFKNNLNDNNQQIIDTLFGREPEISDKQDIGDAGYIIFNDAWWIPSSKPPLVKEIITVHHQEYYKGAGAKATDFDSPNPNPQIAIQGSFLFSVEGDTSWAEYAINELKQVLKDKGIGAKTASGYGYFTEDKMNQKVINDKQLDNATPEETIALKVAALTLKNLPIILGKQRSPKTQNDIGKQYWENYITQVREKFSGDIQDWGKSDKNKVKAYKTIMGKWTPKWDDK